MDVLALYRKAFTGAIAAIAGYFVARLTFGAFPSFTGGAAVAQRDAVERGDILVAGTVSRVGAAGS